MDIIFDHLPTIFFILFFGYFLFSLYHILHPTTPEKTIKKLKLGSKIYKGVFLIIFFSFFGRIAYEIVRPTEHKNVNEIKNEQTPSITKTTISDDYLIDDFDVKIFVDKNGVASIEEKISVDFKNKRHGIIRYVPYVYKGEKEHLGNKFLKISDIAVFKIIDSKKIREHFKTKENGYNLFIKIGHPNVLTDGKQTYIIKYKATGAIKKGEEDLFSWNLIGNDWDTNILNTKAIIYLPKDIFDLKKDISFYIGYLGSNEKSNHFFIQNDSIVFELNKTLSPGENASVFITFPPKTFLEYPSSFYRDQFIFKVKEHLAYLAYIIGLLHIFFAYKIIKKYMDTSYVPTPTQYNTPEDMDPLAFSFFLKRQIQPKDIVPLIFYFADKGYLKITKEEDNFFLEKLSPLSEGAPFYQDYIFNEIFKVRSKVNIDSLGLISPFFFNNLNGHLNNHMVDNEFFFKSPFFSKDALTLFFLLIMCFFLIVSILYFAPYDAVAYPSIITLFITWIFIFSCVIFMAKREYIKTSKGKEVYSRCKGYELFLKKVDIPQIKILMGNDPSFFSQALPYAMACGFTNKFISKFKDITFEKLNWYTSSDNEPFSIRNINVIKNGISSSLPSGSISSGGGSASSGGGSFSGSGGGFGGGGGRSW